MKVFVYEESIVIYNSLYFSLKIYSRGAESISFDAPIIHRWLYREKARMMTMIDDDVNKGNELLPGTDTVVMAKHKRQCLGKKIPLNNSGEIVT